MQGRIADLNVSIFNSKQRLTLELDGDFRLQYDELKDKPLEITIKPYRKKRSLDQNSLLWAILGKIADKLRANKDDVYLTMIKRYGQGGVVKVRKQDEETIIRGFDYYEEHEKLYSDDEKYYRVWVGSSKYNTEELSILLDGVISEAKEMGIEFSSLEESSLLEFIEELERSRAKQ